MRNLIFLICFLFTCHHAVSQDQTLTSEEALEKYGIIRDSMSLTFPENDINTYKRSSFSEKELQTYLSLHFQRMDLLSKIENHHTLKLDFYLYSGNWFKKIGFPKESIKSYNDFFTYFEAHENALSQSEKEKYVEMRNFAYGVLAENYAITNDLKNASKTYQKSLAFSKLNSQIYYPSALNNYGLYHYWYKRELDSALYYFKKAYSITKTKFPDHTLIGSIRDNIADVYLEKGEYSKALPLYQTNYYFYQNAFNERTKTKDIPRLISAGTQLIAVYLKEGNTATSKTVFNQLDSIIKIEKHNGSIGASSWLEFLRAKHRLEAHQHNYGQAYATALRLKTYSDSLRQISNDADAKWHEELNNVTLDRIALNFEIDRIQRENKIASQHSKLWIVSLTSSLVLIILVSLFLRRRQYLIIAKNKQLLAEQTLENSQLKVERLNREIKSKKRDLSDFAINLSQNQEWAERLAQKIEAIKTADTKERKVLIEELEQDVSNKINFDSETKNFFERLDKLSNSFYSKLNERFPNLSKNEIRLCSLIRLKIDSRSIANLQNITLASLNTSRYRLRKKLDLTETEDLDLFIQNL